MNSLSSSAKNAFWRDSSSQYTEAATLLHCLKVSIIDLESWTFCPANSNYGLLGTSCSPRIFMQVCLAYKKNMRTSLLFSLVKKLENILISKHSES